jgi:nitrate/nitrite-specific signal transduction histidine kinase
VQEALNNVARHSGSKQSWVRLRFVRDDASPRHGAHPRQSAALWDAARQREGTASAVPLESGKTGASAPAGSLELEIEDRGTGFTTDKTRQGIGLVAMRERAQLVNGVIEFLQPAQGGTLVRLRVPREAPEANV